MESPQLKTLLIGFGDLAQRLAPLLPGEYTAIRRGPSADPRCQQLDATDLQGMSELLGAGFDQIVITLTPNERTDEAYRLAYIKPVQVLLAALEVNNSKPRILFVSSTAVFGQNNGETIDEASATEPEQFNGKRLLEAEQLLRSSGFQVICARLSGIYGPMREKLSHQVQQGLPIKRNLLAFSNRIHVDDAARALAHLLGLAQPDSIYLVSDDKPVLLAEVVQGLAVFYRVESPKRSDGALFSGKRVNNRRLRATGFQLLYPSWREGYGIK